CTISAMPQRRLNSIERIERPLILGIEMVPSRRSTTRHSMPAMPSSIASASPTGPPPAIRTGSGAPLMARTVRWASSSVNDGYQPIAAAARSSIAFGARSRDNQYSDETRNSGRNGMAELRDKFAASNVIAMWDQELRPTLPLVPSHIWRWQEVNPLIGEAANAVNMDDAERRVLILAN